jgi:hypothetical protein
MNLDRRNLLDSSLWTAQAWLATVTAASGLLKTMVPATDLQLLFGMVPGAQPGILGPVGLVELILALLLVLPAGARVLPRLTPVAAAGLGATVLLGLLQPATAGGFGLLVPDLLLLACSAFIAWGRLVGAPITSATFGTEPDHDHQEALALLVRNRWRHAARRAGSREVA